MKKLILEIRRGDVVIQQMSLMPIIFFTQHEALQMEGRVPAFKEHIFEWKF